MFFNLMAILGIGSATVRPTSSFSFAISLIMRTTSSIFIPFGTTPTAAMISVGSSTSMSKCTTTCDAPHPFSQLVTVELSVATSSGVRCFIPYSCWRTFISSRSQSRKPTNRILSGDILAGSCEMIFLSPSPIQPLHGNPYIHRQAV